MLYQVNGTDVVGKMSISNLDKEIEKANHQEEWVYLETPLNEFLECYEYINGEIALKADWESIKATKEAQLADATYNEVMQEAVPNTITLRQAREQTIRMNIFVDIETYIESLTDATEKAIIRNYWEYSEVFERHNSILLSLAKALELSDADLDTLFIEASQL